MPFQGQKRQHIKEFSNLIKELRPNMVVDLFGGSGLLSHVAKRANPKSRVIYNDYDNYCQRLAHVDKTNELIRWLRNQFDNLPARNKRSVWTVPTKGFKGAHFATFPPDLIRTCIAAGCPLDGIVLAPFMGAGTTALVARNVGIELNKEYVKMAEERRGVKTCTISIIHVFAIPIIIAQEYIFCFLRYFFIFV